MSLPSLGGYAAWMRAKQEWTSDDAVLSLLSLEAYLAYATHCQRAESGAETHFLGTLPGEDNNNTDSALTVRGAGAVAWDDAAAADVGQRQGLPAAAERRGALVRAVNRLQR